MSRQQKTLTRRRLCLGVMIFAAVYVAILVHVAHIPHGIQQAPPPGLRQRAAVPEPPTAKAASSATLAALSSASIAARAGESSELLTAYGPGERSGWTKLVT